MFAKYYSYKTKLQKQLENSAQNGTKNSRYSNNIYHGYVNYLALDVLYI